MDISEIRNIKTGFIEIRQTQSSIDSREILNKNVDSTPCDSLIEELDSYWDDINTRLIVSRMVGDAVMKGMLSAISQESEEKIASLEVEIESLKKDPYLYPSNGFGDEILCCSNTSVIPETFAFITNPGVLSVLSQCKVKSQVDNLKFSADQQFRNLQREIDSIRKSHLCSKGIEPDNSKLWLTDGCWVKMENNIDSLNKTMEALYEQVIGIDLLAEKSIEEQVWKMEIQEEVTSIVIKNSIWNIQEEYEAKLWQKEKEIFAFHDKNRINKIENILNLKTDLDDLSKSLLGAEVGNETNDKISNKKKEHIREENGLPTFRKFNSLKLTNPDTIDASQLRHMTNYELIAHFKTEMTEMNRNHETKVQDLSKKNELFDSLKKKMPNIIKKLDGILLDNEKVPVFEENYRYLCDLKDRVDYLVCENRRLKDLLSRNRKEVKCVSSLISAERKKVLTNLVDEKNLLKQIKKINWEMENERIDSIAREETNTSIFSEFMLKMKCELEDFNFESIIRETIGAFIFGEVIRDCKYTMGHLIMKYDEEKKQRSFLEAELMERKKKLHLELEEKEQIKQGISLSTMVDDKDKQASIFMKQEENFKLLSEELENFREKAIKQERLISKNNKELESFRNMLGEILGQISVYESKINQLERELTVAKGNMEEAEKQIAAFQDIIQEKRCIIENKISWGLEKEKHQLEKMEAIIVSIQQLSYLLVDLESRVMRNIQQKSLRLERVNHQFEPLVRCVNILTRQDTVYKDKFEKRRWDLRKAEAEVDLLGDEVGALLSLLEKTYITLDHYSPVLQHYPGMMEILKMVREELIAEANRNAGV